jgi:subtilisin family serine protease
VAGTKTNLTAFRSNNPHLTGKGVIVGVIDTGLDPLHPAFAGRVLSIWDQTMTGPGWGLNAYGQVLTSAAGNLGVTVDKNGHGTHVAGTAVGSDPQFPGVAPDADLIMVKTTFNNAHIASGIQYIFAEAARLGRAAVVNLSLGGHFNAHDGTDALSELINQEVGPGKIVVAAAGNEGTDNIHGAAVIPAGQTGTIRFKVTPNTQSGSPEWVLLNGWYDGKTTCDISVRTSSGGITNFQPVIQNGNPTQVSIVNNMRIGVTTPAASSAPNGDHEFRVEIQSNNVGGLVQGGTWEVRIRNNSTVDPANIDIWSMVSPGALEAEFLAPNNDPNMKIGSPGSAGEAITVASYTSRNSWTDAGGGGWSVGLTLDDISDFSSPGPLRNGGLKPDVAAPGAMIVSALSAQSKANPQNVVNPNFRVNSGTSMACPFIAGLCALLLEKDSTLAPAAIKQMLQDQSQVPGQPASTHDIKWGYGLIDAGGL